MEEFLNVLTDALVALLALVVPALLAWLGPVVRNYLQEKIRSANNMQIEWFAKQAVQMVEQVYRDLAGQDKLDYAIVAVTNFATENGIDITEAQVRSIIESAVFEMNQWWTPTGLLGATSEK